MHICIQTAKVLSLIFLIMPLTRITRGQQKLFLSCFQIRDKENDAGEDDSHSSGIGYTSVCTI